MLSLKNVCASCMHLFAVGSSVLLSFFVYNNSFEYWIYLDFISAFDQAFTPYIYLKSNSIRIMKVF